MYNSYTMNIEDEYPSGADIERVRNYRLRKQRELEEIQSADSSKTKDEDTEDLESEECVEFRVSDNNHLSRFEENEKHQTERIKLRQFFMPWGLSELYPPIIYNAAIRTPRRKSFHYSDDDLSLIGDNTSWETLIEGFVHTDKDIALQIFPFSYPEDYLGHNKDYRNCTVLGSGNLDKEQCDYLYYNPLDPYGENSCFEYDFEDEWLDILSIVDDIDFRLVNAYRIIKDSIIEALEDMGDDLRNADSVDITMDIPTSLHKFAVVYYNDVLSYYKKHHPKVAVRLSINEFVYTNELNMCTLRWKYIAFFKSNEN